MVDLAKLRNLADAARAKSVASKKQRSGESWYRIANSDGATTGSAEVYIYDFIGEWGVTASDFVSELKSVSSDAIDLHINSKGGEVFDGLAIYEALKQHPASVNVYVDSIAASAASFIAMAGDRITMARNSKMMIHDASGLVIGNATDMREMATLLDDLSDNIADIYAERSGKNVKHWRNIMKNEKWYGAQEAVDAGLADEVAGGNSSGSTSNEAVTPTYNLDPTDFQQVLREAGLA